MQMFFSLHQSLAAEGGGTSGQCFGHAHWPLTRLGVTFSNWVLPS